MYDRRGVLSTRFMCGWWLFLAHKRARLCFIAAWVRIQGSIAIPRQTTIHTSYLSTNRAFNSKKLRTDNKTL
jgi:hypothetical protein